MKFLDFGKLSARKLWSLFSGPVTLLFVLGIFGFGFFALLGVTSLAATYNHITLNVIYVIPLLFLIKMYLKDRKSMLSETLWKVESKTVVISGLVLMLLISLNYWQGIVSAPIALFVYGLYCINIVYLISKEGKESAVKSASDPSYKFTPFSSKIPKWALGNVIALLIISGYWFNEIQINEQETRNEGNQIALDLANYSVYFGPPSKASIRVDSIETVNFTKVESSEVPGKVFEMCVTFRLEASQDGFYFEELYPSEQVCVKPSSWYSGWSDTDLREKVKKLVMGKYE
jgi:hypothetical protein